MRNKRSTDQGVLARPVGLLHLLCEVRPSDTDETLGLPTDVFQAVLAEVVQQHGTGSSLRLTSRSLAYGCGALLTGTLYLKPPEFDCRPREVHRWLWQVGILQRAFPNSTLKLDRTVHTDKAADIHRLLSCTKLRGVTIWPTSCGPDRRLRPFWQALAGLGRLHGSRLQLHLLNLASPMLEAEPSLAAHISEAEVTRYADARSSLADQISRLSGLTKLMLPDRPVLAEAGVLDALRHLSALQSLHCMSSFLQTLLVNSVPSSWSLLTRLQITRQDLEPDWSLLEQQCPQLEALCTGNAVPLCLTALTSLTCTYWLLQDTNSFQCSRLVDLHLHVEHAIDLRLLPSTLTSLCCAQLKAHNQDQYLRGRQPLVHICFTELVQGTSSIQGLVQANERSVLATSVTSVKLTIERKAFISPDMKGQHFYHLVAWFPHLQRVHIHLSGVQEEKTVISAAWLPAHCRLVVTHNGHWEGPVRVVKCPAGCLSLPMSSHLYRMN